MSLRDKILKITDDTPSELVEIPEWDVKVLVRGMTLAGKDDFLANIVDTKTSKTNVRNFTSGILIACSYDPDSNERLFTEADIPILKEKSAVAVQRIVDVGTRLSGLTDEAVDVAGKDSSSTTSVEPDSL
jgi:hypothetical protein